MKNPNISSHNFFPKLQVTIAFLTATPIDTIPPGKISGLCDNQNLAYPGYSICDHFWNY